MVRLFDINQQIVDFKHTGEPWPLDCRKRYSRLTMLHRGVFISQVRLRYIIIIIIIINIIIVIIISIIILSLSLSLSLLSLLSS